jgi:hypothetical protein
MTSADATLRYASEVSRSGVHCELAGELAGRLMLLGPEMLAGMPSGLRIEDHVGHRNGCCGRAWEGRVTPARTSRP